MAADYALLEQAIAIISSVRGLYMDPDALADDVILLAYVWPDEGEFKMAVARVHRALTQLVEGNVEGSPLKYGFSGWHSFHFQHRRGQQSRAGMRIVYMPSTREFASKDSETATFHPTSTSVWRNFSNRHEHRAAAASACRRSAKRGQSVRIAVKSLRSGTSSIGTHSISMLSSSFARGTTR